MMKQTAGVTTCMNEESGAARHGWRGQAWLQLLRAPNLLTVPGDPLAGYLLSGCVYGGTARLHAGAAAAVAVSVLLYAAGLVHNDLCDVEEDRAERPHRPLPSGAIRAGHAHVVALLLAASAFLIAVFCTPVALVTAAVVAASIFTYNRFAKDVPALGAILMGLCRGLSLFFGAAVRAPNALASPGVVASALFLTTVVAGITHLAARETVHRLIGPARWFPGIAGMAWLLACGFLLRPPDVVAAVAGSGLGVIAVTWLLYCGHGLRGIPEPGIVQTTIGRFIRGLLPIQAALTAATGQHGLIVAALLLFAWPVAGRLSRRFAAS